MTEQSKRQFITSGGELPTDALWFENAESNTTALGYGKFQLYSVDGDMDQWVVPNGVTSISVIAVGAGGGAHSTSKGGCGGGALRWANNVSVTPGEVIKVRCGKQGTKHATSPSDYGNNNWGGNTRNSSVRRANETTIICEAHSASSSGGTSGGTGENSTSSSGSGGGGGNLLTGAGGGAAGYSGNGGNGGQAAPTHNTGSGGTVGTNASGGGGGGGGGTRSLWSQFDGGEVYLWSEGDSGAGGAINNQGGVGSQTGTGSTNPPQFCRGGGGGSNGNDTWGQQNPGKHGAIRIVWPGDTRQFPNTNVDYPL